MSDYSERRTARLQDSRYWQQIKRESIILLYAQSRMSLVASTLNALILVYLLWEPIDHRILTTWLFLVIGLGLIRGTLAYLYFKYQPPLGAQQRWANAFTIAALFTGLVWGSSAIFLYTPESVVYQALLFFLLGGMGAGAFASLSCYMPAFYAFFIPTFLPITLRILFEGDPLHLGMGLWGLTFFIIMIVFSRNSNRTQLESIRFRIHNQVLVEELQQKSEQAEKASTSKSRFLAAASHDLRQPLYALGLYSEKLRFASSLDEARNTGHMLSRSFHSLKGLLDSLLDISKLDAGVITARPKNFALQSIFDRILFDFEPRAIDKDIDFRIVRTSAHLYTDPVLLERILQNLVANAVRYTHHGKVLLGARRRGTNYEIQCLDTGIGIGSDVQEKIYDEFYQVDNPERDREKGFGLGLSIVNRLTTILKGDLCLSSQEGSGSVFSVSLPAGEKTSSPQTVHDQFHTINDLDVMVIDDDQIILHATRTFLEMYGYRVTTSEDLDDALLHLDLMEKAPDIIISDYRLRDNCNGIDAVDTILAKLENPIPVIIVTGDTDPERIREVSSRGYHIMHKPVQPSDLNQAISRHIFSQQ